MEILSILVADSFRIFILLAFVAAVLFLEGAYLLWSAHRSPEAKKIQHRLQVLAAGAAGSIDSSIVKQRLLSEVPALHRLLWRVPRLRAADRMLEQSGLRLTMAHLLGLAAVSCLTVGGAAVFMRLPPLPTVALGAAAAMLPLLYVQRCRIRRIRTIERQLPDALDLISRALRAGHAFDTGMKMVGQEMTEPIAGEFRLTQDEVNFGVSLQQALLNLASRIPSTDLSYFVIAVLIQRDSGGNLTEVLGKLSELIRERFKLLEKVRVLSAEGKLSAWILGLLPFVVAGAINVINPGFMKVLWTDPLGLSMLNAALVMMMLGILWMRQIIRIHV